MSPKAGRITIGVGILVAVSPILVAIVGGLVTGSSWANESDGWGALIWLVFLSAPAGLAIVIAGVVAGSSNVIRSALKRRKASGAA